MNGKVLVKGLFLATGFPTNFACKQAFFLVSIPVFAQLRLLIEGFRANFTAKAQLSRMYSHVSLEEGNQSYIIEFVISKMNDYKPSSY